MSIYILNPVKHEIGRFNSPDYISTLVPITVVGILHIAAVIYHNLHQIARGNKPIK